MKTRVDAHEIFQREQGAVKSSADIVRLGQPKEIDVLLIELVGAGVPRLLDQAVEVETWVFFIISGGLLPS